MSKKNEDIKLAELEQDDRDWLNIFTGENVPEANPKIQYEARGFREAIRTEMRLQKITKRLFWYRMIRRVKYHFIKFFSCFGVSQLQVAIPAIFVGVVLGWLLHFYFTTTETVLVARNALPETTGIVPSEYIYSHKPQQTATDLKEEFISAGADVEIITTFQVKIKIPENPSEDLRDLCDDYDIKLKKETSSPQTERLIVSSPKQ